MNSSTLIATSIVPDHRIKIQKEAVFSWLNAGMEVISLNTNLEIEKLTPIFNNVAFIPQIRTGKLLFGKPYIFISEILNYLRSTNHSICGIINSDISLIADTNLHSFLKEQARGSLVYGPRYQVSSFDDSEGEVDPLGFDYFIFDRRLIPDWNETHFCLGLPSWDHWFPLVPTLIGHRVKKLTSPIARHIPHAVPTDRNVIPFNNEFVRQIVNRFSLTEHNLSKLISPTNAISFNEFDFVDRYGNLVADVEENLKEIDASNIDKYRELAKLFDEFTRYSIRFLEKYSEKIEFAF